ncbi:GntR family transcriptional regulator [Roseivivax sp. CAU 1753]
MPATYREIKADILGKIHKGVLAPGSLMPNEVDLARSYGCARATVNRAMRELADDGIIERRRKAGTWVRPAPIRQARFVLSRVREEIENQGARYGYALVSRAVETASAPLRSRLALEPGGKVLHLICTHHADGTPYQLEDRWINLAMNPAAAQADFAATGPTEWLTAAVPFSDVEISLQAVRADAATAQHLGCLAGDALLQTERSTWWEGRAVAFVQLTHRPGHRMTTRC